MESVQAIIEAAADRMVVITHSSNQSFAMRNNQCRSINVTKKQKDSTLNRLRSRLVGFVRKTLNRLQAQLPWTWQLRLQGLVPGASTRKQTIRINITPQDTSRRPISQPLPTGNWIADFQFTDSEPLVKFCSETRNGHWDCKISTVDAMSVKHEILLSGGQKLMSKYPFRMVIQRDGAASMQVGGDLGEVAISIGFSELVIL